MTQRRGTTTSMPGLPNQVFQQEEDPGVLLPETTTTTLSALCLPRTRTTSNGPLLNGDNMNNIVVGPRSSSLVLPRMSSSSQSPWDSSSQSPWGLGWGGSAGVLSEEGALFQREASELVKLPTERTFV